jgi:hypothetical protein
MAYRPVKGEATSPLNLLYLSFKYIIYINNLGSHWPLKKLKGRCFLVGMKMALISECSKARAGDRWPEDAAPAALGRRAKAAMRTERPLDRGAPFV